MTHNKTIPGNINDRLIHFRDEVKKYFSFLADFDYRLKTIETGRTDTFLDYYCNFSYKNLGTHISIDYSTDIINGQKIAFPEVKEKPIIDNRISCFISDPNAFMSIDQFAEVTQPNLPVDYFLIGPETEKIKENITRIVRNYSNFFQDNLSDVLKKEKIYDCYTDRFYDKVFEEKLYC